jgi:hypothetical protein
MTTPLIGPDGRKYTLERDEPAALDAAIKAGYRVETAETPQTTLEGLKETAADVAAPLNAAGLGALQGATAGGYGAYVGTTQPHETKQAMLTAMEENPLATGVGELAGMVASPINKLMPAIEGTRAATALGRLGQKAISGGVVGSLYGAGNTVSDAALGDTQLTAEKLIAGAGLGAVLGSLGGGVGGAIEEGAAKLLPKLSTVIKGGQSALDEVADHATLKAFRNTAKELRKYADADVADAVATVRERGHLKLSPEAMEKSLAADASRVGADKGAFLDAAEAAGTKPSPSGFLKALDDFEAGLGPTERQSIAADLKNARKAFDEISMRPVTATGKTGSGWRAFDAEKQAIQARAKFSKGPAGVDDLTLPLKRQLAGAVRAELDRQLVPALGAEGQAFLDTKKLYGSLKTAERLAGTGAGRGTSFSLVDIASSIGAGGLHPLGLATGLGTKLLRENGAAIIAQTADRLSKSPALKAVAQSFAAMLPTTAPKLGSYGPSLLLAAQRSPELALAQHIVTAQLDPTYSADAQLAGLRPETPDEHLASLSRATDLAATQAAMLEHDRAIDEGLQHVIKGTRPAASSPVLKTQDFGAKRMRQESHEAHRRRVEELRQLAADPQALIDRSAKNLTSFGAVAPAVSAAMTATAQRAVTYLAKAAEVPPKPGPLARDWVPTQAERHKFALKLEAVQDPMSILRHAARGTLVRPQLEAVRAVYPSFAKAVEDRALEQLASGEPMPYRARLMLSLLTGVSADGTTRPQAIAANQRAITNAAGKPSEQMGQVTEGAELGDARRMSTPGQRREMEKQV